MSDRFEMWAILELMGHRRLAGRVTEQEIAGEGFLRIDIPSEPPATQFYSPKSVYAITPTTEEMARRAANIATVQPVHKWELRELPVSTSPLPRAAEYDDSDQDGMDDGGDAP